MVNFNLCYFARNKITYRPFSILPPISIICIIKSQCTTRTGGTGSISTEPNACTERPYGAKMFSTDITHAVILWKKCLASRPPPIFNHRAFAFVAIVCILYARITVCVCVYPMHSLRNLNVHGKWNL